MKTPNTDRAHVAYVAICGGAAIKSHDQLMGGFDAARKQVIQRAAWDTALGPDRVHPGGINNTRYHVETAIFDGDRYHVVARQEIQVERDVAAARAFLRLGPV